MGRPIDEDDVLKVLHGYFDSMLETDTWSPCDLYSIIENLPSAQPLSETDLLELEHRFGQHVRHVVEDMLSGEGKRWEE